MQEDLKLAERRQKILDLLNIENRVLVSELSRRFSISEVTIRNDLAELEHRGLLERVHGGAISTKRGYYNMTLTERSQANVEAKKIVAERAAAIVDDGETLLINAGTTTLLVAMELKKKRNLKVVTNSIPIAQAIADSEGNSAILLGGELNERYLFTVDEGGTTAKRVTVETGLVGKTQTEITSGLTAGDRVVTKGQSYLSDGDPVRVVSGEG